MAGMVCWLALASTYPGGLAADTFVRSERIVKFIGYR